jgi:hypothetical protein
MAILSNISNLVECGLSDLLGGGNEGCGFEFENLAGGELRFWKPGEVVPKETDYNRAYIRSQQKAGNVIIMNSIYNFAWNNEENVLITAENSGLKSLSDFGKYEVMAYFKKGMYNQKQLSSISIDNYWNVQLVDGAGNELWSETSSGDNVGFATALCSVLPMQFKSRQGDLLTGIQIQFSRPKQMNDQLAWITAESLDYSVGELDGVNQITTTITPPSNLATTVVAKVVLSKDQNFKTGLAVTNFLYKVNGATVTPTDITADATAKTYTFTVAALATDDQISLMPYDSSGNTDVIEVGVVPNEKLFKGKEATATVIA